MELILLCFYKVIRIRNYKFLKEIIPILFIIFYRGKFFNYRPEMLYFV